MGKATRYKNRINSDCNLETYEIFQNVVIKNTNSVEVKVGLEKLHFLRAKQTVIIKTDLTAHYVTFLQIILKYEP